MTLRYLVEDWVVRELEFTGTLEDAIDTALAFDTPEFVGLDEDTSLYVEVRDDNWTIIFWANSDGERGSDYDGADEQINAIIDRFL